MKIVQRFMLTVSLPILICLTVMAILLYTVSNRKLEGEHQKRQLINGWQIRTLMAESIELAKKDLSIFMTNKLLEQYFMFVDVGEADYEEDVRATLEENLLAASKAFPKYASLRLFSVEGEGIVNITFGKTAYKFPDPRETAWFRSSLDMDKGEVHVSEVLPCPEHGEPSIFISRLFYYWDEARAIGSIHLHCQDFFAEVLKGTELGVRGQAFLVNEKGEIIAHVEQEKQGRIGGAVEPIHAVLSGQQPMVIENVFDNGMELRRFYFPLQMTGLATVIELPMDEIQAVSRILKHQLILVTVGITLVLTALIYLTLKSIIRPLDQLERTAKKISQGDLEARVHSPRKDEIGSLASSFDTMVDNLYTTQKELRKALDQVQQLSGLLPICSSCKKIRDDQGYWSQIEHYIGKHSEAQFSHGICPDCAQKLYPKYYDEIQKSKQ